MQRAHRLKAKSGTETIPLRCISCDATSAPVRMKRSGVVFGEHARLYAAQSNAAKNRREATTCHTLQIRVMQW
jgi:hypothetical protein